MRECLPISVDNVPVPFQWDAPGLADQLKAAQEGVHRKIVVLDDDPTGVQTVHNVPVYTNWEEETLREAFAGKEPLFFILTNSRGMTAEESERQHRLIARRIVKASEQLGMDYVVISRSDSTMRGHYPMETAVLRKEIEARSAKRFAGEIIYPFFAEGGRFTLDSVHYVQEGDRLIPCGQTEYAQDKSFGYHASYLPDFCEEKSQGSICADAVIRITLEDLREEGVPNVQKKLMSAKGFCKIVVDSLCYTDVMAFSVAFWRTVGAGKEFLFRSAAAVPKILGNVGERPLLQKTDLVAEGNRNGGVILVGSHVPKTTRQLALLQNSGLPVRFLEFNQHRVLEAHGLDDEVARTVAQAAEAIGKGETVVVYTRRDRLDLPDADGERQLKISVEISDAVTSVIAKLPVQPRFILAKGGITSSDVGVKALRVKKAVVMGQVRPGIPVWITGEESKFPHMPYIIFPGNVGTDRDLLDIVQMLIGSD